MQNLPVLFLAHMRFDSILREVRYLINFSNRDIYVSLDLANSEDWRSKQYEFINNLNAIEAHSGRIYVQISNKNLGLREAILWGVSWFFKENARGIVLEDDLEISPQFYVFCDEAIGLIEQSDDVLLLSGNRFPCLIKDGQLPNQCLTSTYPLIWGWATTRQKWEKMNSLILKKKVDRSSEARIRVRNYWRAGRYRVNRGTLNSWALPLADAMHHEKYRCLLPGLNYVSNVGADTYATHTAKWHGTMNIEVEKTITAQKLTLEESFTKELDSILEEHVYGIKLKNVLSPFFAMVEVFFESIRR